MFNLLVTKYNVTNLLLAPDHCQGLGHQLLVDTAKVGHLLLTLVVDVHPALYKREKERESRLKMLYLINSKMFS